LAPIDLYVDIDTDPNRHGFLACFEAGSNPDPDLLRLTGPIDLKIMHWRIGGRARLRPVQRKQPGGQRSGSVLRAGRIRLFPGFRRPLTSKNSSPPLDGFLETHVDKLKAAVSTGYARGRIDMPPADRKDRYD